MPGASPRRVNCVRWRLMFVGPRYGTCVVSPSWRLEFFKWLFLDCWKILGIRGLNSILISCPCLTVIIIVLICGSVRYLHVCEFY